MTVNSELKRASEWAPMRGFANMFYKENYAWWRTRRWWVNAIVWIAILCILVAFMLFVLPGQAAANNDPSLAEMGGPLALAQNMGLTIFFQVGALAIGIGTIILCQGLIAHEKETGLIEWLLAKPVTRRAYILSKLASSLIAVLVLLIGGPALVTIGLFYLRMGLDFPLIPFLQGTGILIAHTVFYLCLTVMLGTVFSKRTPIMGIAVGTLVGGNVLAGFISQTLYFTPWGFGRVALSLASSEPVPAGMLWPPLIITIVFSVLFITVGLVKFEKSEF
jgi:ABC-2 type transport system permease protein